MFGHENVPLSDKHRHAGRRPALPPDRGWNLYRRPPVGCLDVCLAFRCTAWITRPPSSVTEIRRHDAWHAGGL